MSKKKLFSALAAVIVLTVFCHGPISVSAEEPKTDYVLSQDFTYTAGVWQYYWYNDGYNPLMYDGQREAWHGEEYGSAASSVLVTKDMMWHPGTAGYTTVAFTAPESGSVTIGMEQPLELLNPDLSDGTVFSAISDFQMIGEQHLLTKENPKQEFEPVTIDVYKGQNIYFYLYMNTNNAGDSTRVTPYIKYNEFKDVPVPETVEEEEEEAEPVLRTDVKAMEIADENQSAGINVISVVSGAATAIGFSAIVFAVVLLIKRMRRTNK